jgi:hypothetical protein
MWNVNARGWESEPPNLSRADKSESQSNRYAQSDVGPEPGRRVKKWSGGFVKPDGTQIRLFVSRLPHAQAS